MLYIYILYKILLFLNLGCLNRKLGISLLKIMNKDLHRILYLIIEMQKKVPYYFCFKHFENKIHSKDYVFTNQ